MQKNFKKIIPLLPKMTTNGDIEAAAQTGM